MDSRLVIRHLSSSKANQVEEFPLSGLKEVTIGRDPSCDVQYDPDQEDLISRRHAKISVEKENPPEFSVSDLGSRNGTFVNKQRIFSSVRLAPGDVVQLGPGGPEFQFDLDPPPQGVVRPTRLAGVPVAQSAPGPTREAPLAAAAIVTPAAPAVASGMVGRATVERMIAVNKKQTSRNMAIAGGLVVVLIAAVGAFMLLRKPAPAPPMPPPVKGDTAWTPNQIAQTYTDSTVYVEMRWKLYFTEAGKQVFHVYAANQTKDKKGKVAPIVNLPMETLPVFVLVNGAVEPMLTTTDGGGKFHPIGSGGTGSGFVVSPDGFILTNRHVAAAWTLPYSWEEDAGLLLVLNGNGEVTQKVPIPKQKFPSPWVPAKAKFLLDGAVDAASIRMIPAEAFIMSKPIEGRNDYLDVTFAKNRIRIPAKIARVSDRADVAMIKVDIPQSLHKIELNDNWDVIKPGDAVTSLGYPSVSPAVIGAIGGVTAQSTGGPEAKIIPDPTLSVGNIARIIRGRAGLTEATYSTFGDVYQMTINSTGHGNSGGPVFDDRGRAIGIFTYGKFIPYDAAMSFAVPIRYAIELMGTKPAD